MAIPRYNLTVYNDWKAVVANYTDPYDIYYSTAGSFFNAVLIDRAGRFAVSFAVPSGSAPASFNSDFPSAVLMSTAISYQGTQDINL